MLLGMAAKVMLIAAVAVILSFGHNPSQGVSVSTAIGLGVDLGSAVGVSVAGSMTGSQAVKGIKIRLAKQNRKIPESLMLMAPYLSNRSCS